jgi:dTDP-4-amino-4,6-dideoxygalactose transaminase
LTACLEAVDLATGDEVILPGYTCIVVDNAVRAFGATPVYCDIELNTFGADLRSVQHCITENTKVVILPHLYGLVCRDYQQITDFCRSRCIYTIEDCAHSTGAIFRGRRVGNLADMAFYSCEWTKPLTTILGGIATTNNVQLSRRLCDFHDRCIEQDDKTINRMLRTLILTFFDIHRQDSIFAYPYHRFRWFIEPTASTSEEEYCGRLPSDYFTRMSAAAARIGIEQLSILDSLNDSRRETASIWAEWCKRSGYPLPTVISESEPIFLRFPILVEPERKLDTSWALKELGVRPGVWFKSGLHPTDVRLPECPNAEIAISRCINFPCLIGPDLFRRLRSQFLNRS